MSGSGGTQASDSDKSFFCAGPRNPSSIEQHLQGTSTQSPSSSAVAAPDSGPSAGESVPRGRPLRRDDARAHEAAAGPSTEPAAAAGPEAGPSNVHGGSTVIREQAARLNLPPSAPIDIPERNSRMTEEDEDLARQADDERNYRHDVLNAFVDLVHEASLHQGHSSNPQGERLFRLFEYDRNRDVEPTRGEHELRQIAERLINDVQPLHPRRHTYDRNVRMHARLLVIAVSENTGSATPPSSRSGRSSLDFSGLGSDEGHPPPPSPPAAPETVPPPSTLSPQSLAPQSLASQETSDTTPGETSSTAAEEISGLTVGETGELVLEPE